MMDQKKATTDTTQKSAAANTSTKNSSWNTSSQSPSLGSADSIVPTSPEPVYGNADQGKPVNTQMKDQSKTSTATTGVTTPTQKI